MDPTSCPSHDQLQAYHAGELPEDAGETLSEHLSQCASCQARVRSLDSQPESPFKFLQACLEAAPYADEPHCQAAVTLAQSLVESALDQPPGRLLGDYELLEILGQGGMGTVYKARHLKLGRIVALKVSRGRFGNPRAAARFAREMQAIGCLGHPHIVLGHDAREIDGLPVLVMEYIDGLDLARLVARVGVLPVPDACELARQVSLGLHATDQIHLIHRDIKPSNVMVSRDGQAKILDLGLALVDAELPAGTGLTHSGDAVGSPDYIAPEQIEDSHRVDIRADLYSLGCTLYYLLTGSPPFAGPQYANRLDKLLAQRERQPAPIRQRRAEIPEQLAAIVARLLAKTPAERYATPLELADALAPLAAASDLPELVRRAWEASPHESGEFTIPTEDRCSAAGHTPRSELGSRGLVNELPPADAPRLPPVSDPAARSARVSDPAAPADRRSPTSRRAEPPVSDPAARSARASDPAAPADRRSPTSHRAELLTQSRPPSLRQWLWMALITAAILLPALAIDALFRVPRPLPDPEAAPAAHASVPAASDSANVPSPGTSTRNWPAPLATAREIVLNESNRGQVRAKLTHPGDVHYYRFVARANQKSEVVVTPEAGLKAKIYLYDAQRDENADHSPDRTDAHVSKNPNGIARLRIEATAGGTYFARVEPYEQQSVGGYRLEIRPVPDSRATAECLTLDAAGGATIADHLGGVSDEHWYIWTAPRTGRLAILADTPSSSLDTLLEFYGDGTAAPLAQHANEIHGTVVAGKQYWLRVRVNQPLRPRTQPAGNYAIEVKWE